MRTIETIREDIVKQQNMIDALCAIYPDKHFTIFEKELNDLYDEETLATAQGIPLDRLEAICNAEREGRCYIKAKPSIADNTIAYAVHLGRVESGILKWTKGFCLYGDFESFGGPIYDFQIGEDIFIGTNAREQAEQALGVKG